MPDVKKKGEGRKGKLRTQKGKVAQIYETSGYRIFVTLQY